VRVPTIVLAGCRGSAEFHGIGGRPLRAARFLSITLIPSITKRAPQPS